MYKERNQIKLFIHDRENKMTEEEDDTVKQNITRTEQKHNTTQQIKAKPRQKFLSKKKETSVREIQSVSPPASMDDDDMDSLFEGMVLFTPSQLSSPPAPSEEAAPAAAESSSPSSEPLDENLFSDLTLVVPDDGHGEPSPSSSPSADSVKATEVAAPPPPPPSFVARQVSRKKKRAAGLRIGYGRHEIDHEADSASTTSSAAGSKQDALSIDSISSQSDKTEQEEAVFLAPAAAQIDHEEPPSPPPVSAEEKSELESVDAGGASEAFPKGNDESIEAKFDRIKADISEKLEQARELVAALSAVKKEAIRKRRRAAEKLNSASARLKDLERSLEEACETEDFETAERLSDDIAEADKERATLADALRDAEAKCDGVDEQMQRVLEAQIASEEECVSLLESFSMEASTKADQIVEEAKLLYEEQMGKWLSSSEALEGKKLELEIQTDVVNEAREVLNSSIDHVIADDKKEKEDLYERKSKLIDELEELLALVKAKEKEIAENDAKIEAVENRITGAVSGFEKTQSNIVENYDRLQSSLSQIDMENKDLLMKKTEIDETLSQQEDKGNKIREIGIKCADEAKAYTEVARLRKGLILSILKFRENKLELVKTEGKLSDDVQKLREEASSARASLQELSSTKSSLQQEIASIEQRILFIDKRLPELEAEKKVAAAARNFKEAARIAAEAKSLSTEKDGMQSEKERTSGELGKLDEEIKETIYRLQEIEEQIISRDKEVAMARIKRLLITAGAAKAEKDAALELGDEEEANLLIAEADAAESEAKRLLPVYDLKEEEINDLPRHFIPLELVSNLGGEQLAEVASSAGIMSK